MEISFFVLFIVALIALPIVARQERQRREWEEEEDRRERQKLAYLEYIANGRKGPSPQEQEAARQAAKKERGDRARWEQRGAFEKRADWKRRIGRS